MHQRDYTLSVKIGDTVYINKRAKNYTGRSAVVLLKDYRRAKVQFEDGETKWFTFYSIEREPIVEEAREALVSYCGNLQTLDEKEFPKEADMWGSYISCPNCHRILFEENRDVSISCLHIEEAVGRCTNCQQRVKWRWG